MRERSVLLRDFRALLLSARERQDSDVDSSSEKQLDENL